MDIKQLEKNLKQAKERVRILEEQKIHQHGRDKDMTIQSITITNTIIETLEKILKNNENT